MPCDIVAEIRSVHAALPDGMNCSWCDSLWPCAPSIAADEIERMHSWDGLMSLLDEHWPDDIFPTLPDDESRDAGPRIVSLLRWVERLRAERGDIIGYAVADEDRIIAIAPVGDRLSTELAQKRHAPDCRVVVVSELPAVQP